jgi:HEPN domain-containing protein
LAKAEQYLNDAENAYAGKKDYNAVTNSARQAVQAASDARSITMRQKAAAAH